jgi:hypothetical protein
MKPLQQLKAITIAALPANETTAALVVLPLEAITPTTERTWLLPLVEQMLWYA